MSDAEPLDCIETRFRRDDADNAGRGVLAEQRALRSAQDLDAFEVRQVIQCCGRTRTIDAVDEYADGRLDAGVVGAVTEAADDEVGIP